VPLKIGDDERNVVFIDTPGHEAFTSMRARGANVTDIVVLVVAADDGVMPQTIESINHSKAAGVPIVVALNKIDKPEATDANIQRILGQLAEHGLNPTDWGGETEVVRTSAVKGEGIQDLLEILDLQSQILELTADFGGAARGTGRRSQARRGPRLGREHPRARGQAQGRRLHRRGGRSVACVTSPTTAASGSRGAAADAGADLGHRRAARRGRQVLLRRQPQEGRAGRGARGHAEREAQLAQPKMTLDRMFGQLAEAELKEILVVLKADVQGSVDVLKNEIEKVSGDEVKVRVLHSAVGGITESDVILAEASRAVIVGFNVIPSAKARSAAENKGVEIRPYKVIYDIVDDMKKAAEGLLEPDIKLEVLGHAEVRRSSACRRSA
jgi:translation initiation factor IF-2